MPSFGETLRRERELRRIPLREVSEATKINIRYLEALERNEFKYLPGGAFTKGFIRAYARYIGVDEAEMLNAYLFELNQEQPQEPLGTPRPAGVETLREHFHVEPGADDRRRRRLRVLVVVGGVVLLVALLAAGLWALTLRRAATRYSPPPTVNAGTAP